MKGANELLIFLFGVLVGATFAYSYTEKKYKEILDAEDDSIPENSSGEEIEENNPTTPNVTASTEKEKELANYYKKVGDLGYNNYSDIELRSDSKPYVIRPEEVGEKEDEGYTFVSLTYYADGVVTDDDDEVMEDLSDTIGEESLQHFGEYEEDSVYVRNDRLKIDYEILMDQRTYEEILEKKPYLRRE